ncbi:magnetosome protein Mad7 [Candidatus Desulfarcum epimagneticum]|uniref:Magnetosome protein Mad7 n=1 Tax=uncultured Desulfobacteraceae bacterium TaxID=218296 RepID=A0A484HI21_9BACT|nr:magnetosome protein Mad7 [uncultured Desulfobacteraceae bacterium]
MKKTHNEHTLAAAELGTQCAICPLRGLFPEVCKLHRAQMMKKNARGAPFVKNEWVCWGAKIVTGAGVGLAGAVAGMAVVPALGVKALLGHMIAYQIAGAASATGAGVNVVTHAKKRTCETDSGKPHRRIGLKRQYTRLPYTLSEKGRKNNAS